MHPPGPAIGQVVTPSTKIYTEAWVSNQLRYEKTYIFH